MTLLNKHKAGFFAFLACLGVAGCATPANDYCLIYSPIKSYSGIKETAPDIYLQIKQNNLVYSELCQ